MTLPGMMGFGDGQGDGASDLIDMGTGAGAEGLARYPSDISIHFPRPFWCYAASCFAVIDVDFASHDQRRVACTLSVELGSSCSNQLYFIALSFFLNCPSFSPPSILSALLPPFPPLSSPSPFSPASLSTSSSSVPLSRLTFSFDSV